MSARCSCFSDTRPPASTWTAWTTDYAEPPKPRSWFTRSSTVLTWNGRVSSGSGSGSQRPSRPSNGLVLVPAQAGGAGPDVGGVEAPAVGREDVEELVHLAHHLLRREPALAERERERERR
eukprot:2519630-Rhodomonas_salina.3